MDRVLITERLMFRKWQENDAPVLYELARVPEIGKGAGWVPHKDSDYSKAIIRTVLSGDEDYAITLKDNPQKPIGSIGLCIGSSTKRGIEREDEGEIGYWLGKDYWGNGYATEALSKLIEHCFKEVGLSRIWCSYFDGNEKSRSVLERCNLKYHHRNEKLYNSMLKEYYNETMMCISAMEYLVNNR
ncbi:MAG: GNAT family N-acetyltransferase [Butyrivibrio sp.]|nr:GNAT family N-acetyltransferase [Butyrivibrio sp.]